MIWVTITLLITSYKLHIGDRVVISILGSVNYSYEEKILSDGKVYLKCPSIGGELLQMNKQKTSTGTMVYKLLNVDAVKISGLTIEEAQKLLEEKFSEYLKNVQVNLLAVTKKQLQVKIFGEVNRPGDYPYEPNRKVVDYITMAGGLTPYADLKNLKIERGDSVIVVGNVNTTVKLGDVIYVPRAYVYITGAVVEPVSYTHLTLPTKA